jgi:hypothetical protein
MNCHPVKAVTERRTRSAPVGILLFHHPEHGLVSYRALQWMD